MVRAAWVPINFQILTDVAAGSVISGGEEYQIIKAKGVAKSALLVSPELESYWQLQGLVEPGLLSEVHIGERKFQVLTSDDRLLLPISECPKPRDGSEIMAFAGAIRRTRERGFDGSLAASIYAERLALFLPLWGAEEELSDDVLLGRYLTGGIPISVESNRRILNFLPWLSSEDLAEIRRQAGLSAPEEPLAKTKEAKSVPKKVFELVGRPELESFFLEHVIDIIENAGRYSAMGLDFPSAILLQGPPGCGKTFSVERLIEYLDWPSYSIDSTSIGSPYIHETGRKIAEVFDRAIQNAPSIVVIDEMEAFLADREIGSGSSAHRIEEVAEFLRNIPEASKKKVLVIGMTNRINMIDPALLRRGRFDHLIEVKMAGEKEITTLLTHLLAGRPCEDGLHIDVAAKLLAGRPLSDVSFVVREASRLSAKMGRLRIASDVFDESIEIALSRETAQVDRKIGFL